jgi:predicted metal-dependent hydrolase
VLGNGKWEAGPALVLLTMPGHWVIGALANNQWSYCEKNLVNSAHLCFKAVRTALMNQKFPYTLRISQKAKHVRFQVSVEKGLEVVVPKRFNPSQLPLLMEKNSQWIERALQKAKSFQGLIGPGPVWQMPEEITLPALGLTWRVLTRRDDIKWVALRETSAKTLLVLGATDDAAACQRALKRWLTRKAEDRLLDWLKRVSERTGLSYAAASVRQQQTRWGSCSSRRLISLNARLLFLPPNLVTYVLVHELCHTKHLNHSQKFWRLVESYLPDCRKLDRQLREASRNIPGWLITSCDRNVTH